MPRGGCWIAYESDYSAFVLFGKETDALRFAVANHMDVGHVTFGEMLGGARTPVRAAEPEVTREDPSE